MQCTCAILSSVACPALQYFSTLSYKRQDFRNKILNRSRVFRLSLQLSSETFFIPRRIERDMIIIILDFIQSTLYFCPNFIKLEFSRHVFKKWLNTKFHKNPPSGNRVVRCWRMDRWTDRLDEVIIIQTAN